METAVIEKNSAEQSGRMECVTTGKRVSAFSDGDQRHKILQMLVIFTDLRTRVLQISCYTVDPLISHGSYTEPLRRFYEGMVKSYDPDKKKHVVLYDDGDVEVLRLEKERWELVADDHRPKKKSPPKVISAKKSKLSDGSETTESAKRSSAVKGKRAQKKNFKREKKVVLHGKNAAASEEVENRSEISNVEPTVSSDIEELEDGDLGQDLVKDVPASGACDVAGKSGIEGLGDSDDAGTDSENSFEDPKSSPESDQRRVVEDSPLDSHASDVKKSHHVDTIIERASQEEFDGKPSQDEFNDKEQKDEAGAKHRSHAADASNAGDGEDADDKPLVLPVLSVYLIFQVFILLPY
ncbi:hypothetical protein Cgig2_005382 [Carnegiea gigantea]|uniref:Uncharacterized protein n=1 Tax=Carnegiea gigantea TaxID=171969 RepID=A0A9Q1K782_9CARY|nr:hypothetical protein Cgig2_005382 [Carnegiea gigantea]